MHGKILRIKFNTNEDVTLGEVSEGSVSVGSVSVETMGGFWLNSGSRTTASGTVIHSNMKETEIEPTTVS